MFLFALWPYSTRRRLEREARHALAALDLAESEFKRARQYLSGVNECLTDAESRLNAKRYAMKQLNAARAVVRIAQKNNLAAIDALNAYKKGG